MSIKISLKIQEFVFLIALSLGILMVFGAKASADSFPGIDATAPVGDSGRFNPSGGTNYLSGNKVTPYYVVGNNSAEYAYSSMAINVYVDTSGGKGDNVSIEALNGQPGCTSVSGGGVVGPDYNTTGGWPPTQYTIYGSGGTVEGQTTVSGTSCGSVNLGTYSVGKAAKMSPRTNSYDGVFTVVAKVLLSPNEGENSFQIAVYGSSFWAAGFVGGSDQVAGIGYRNTNVNDGNHWNAWTVFGLPADCTDYDSSQPVTGQAVDYYDTDVSRTDWNTNMIIELQRQKINPDGTVGGSWETVAGVVQNASQKLSNGSTGKPMQQTGTLYAGNFYTNYRYQVILANVGVRNTIRLKLSGALKPIWGQLSERPTITTCGSSGYSFSCTTSPGSLDNLNPSQAETIRVTATNTGQKGWDPSANNINMHKVVDGSDQGYIALQNSSTGGSTVSPGNRTTFSFNATASASYGTTKTYVFQMYIGGQPMSGSTCTTKLSTKKKTASPYGYIDLSCKTTTIYLKTSAQDTYTKTENASYQTNTPPDIPPNTWFSPPPNNPGGPYKYTYTKNVTVTENPATKIPYEIDFFDNGTGAKVGQQQGVFDTSNGTATQTWDTFNTWNPAFLWPHNGYTAKLSAQVTGSFNRDGPYAYTQTPVDSDSMDPCLTVKYENGYSTVCIDGTTADLEPGDTTTFNYKIGVFSNATNKSFDTNQNGNYSFSVSTNGGFVYTGPSPPSSDSIPPGNSVINIPVQIRADWEGGFTLNFRFRGATLGSGTWNGTWTGICSHNPSCPASGPCDTVATRPYFKSFYGDMKAGGAFLDKNGNCTSECDGNAGTILGYAYPQAGYTGGPRGASTDFGAFALGLIEGDPPPTSGYCGFYDSAINNAKYNNLSFANTGVGLTTGSTRALYGGYMAGEGAPAASDSYAPDYFDKEAKISNPNFQDVSTINDINSPPGSNVGGQYFYQPSVGTLEIKGGTLGTGKQITLFVKGNVYISGDIGYGPWNPLDTSTIPYLTIIAKGNIIIGTGVSSIDGLYIAQGDGVSSGIFATCGSAAGPAGAEDISSDGCRHQLVINGGVIAELIKPYRSNGTLGQARTNERPENGNTGNAAEIFNYSPAIVLGQPNFQPEQSGAVTPGQLEGVFSLPPVF